MESGGKKVIYVNDGGSSSSFNGGNSESQKEHNQYENTSENQIQEGGQERKTSENNGEMFHDTDGEDGEDVRSDVSNKENIQGGGFAGGAKRTSLSSVSSEDTIESQALLEIDPMYIRLTKFLETSGTNKKNLADIVDNIASSLKDLNATFDKMNSNLEKILKLQQNSA